MTWATRTATVVACIVFAIPSTLRAAEDDAKAREQFEKILTGINQRTFVPIKSAIDKKDMISRIDGLRLVDVEVNKVFYENFWEIVEGVFMRSMSTVATNVDGKVIHFEFVDGKGQAVVRFKTPNHSYAYQAWELRHDKRARLKIVDWMNFSSGQYFTADLGDQMITQMPNRNATRKLLASESPSDQQLFQVTEILKATRDRQAPRFFEIYDSLDATSRNDALIAKFAVQMAIRLKDADRYWATLEVFAAAYSTDRNFALLISDLYLTVEQYEKSFLALEKFYQHYDLTEGATPARLSALALVVNRGEDATRYALEAAQAEPTLELVWWSLLRAKAAEQDYEGAIEPLSRLEDDFGHRLDAGKLKRDRFRAFLELADSAPFKEWRATRQ